VVPRRLRLRDVVVRLRQRMDHLALRNARLCLPRGGTKRLDAARRASSGRRRGRRSNLGRRPAGVPRSHSLPGAAKGAQQPPPPRGKAGVPRPGGRSPGRLAEKLPSLGSRCIQLDLGSGIETILRFQLSASRLDRPTVAFDPAACESSLSLQAATSDAWVRALCACAVVRGAEHGRDAWQHPSVERPHGAARTTASKARARPSVCVPGVRPPWSRALTATAPH